MSLLLNKNERFTVISYLTKYLGKTYKINRIESDFLSFDILSFSPSLRHPYYTFVTLGYNSYKANNMELNDKVQLNEMCITLPASWNIDNINDMKVSWPIQLLKDVKIFPYKYNATINPFFIIENNYDELPTIHGTDYSGIILFPTLTLPSDFSTITINNTEIKFHSVVPIYIEEIMYLHKNTAKDFYDLFLENKFTEIVYNDRKNLC